MGTAAKQTRREEIPNESSQRRNESLPKRNKTTASPAAIINAVGLCSTWARSSIQRDLFILIEIY
jgi:hypothetical protein